MVRTPDTETGMYEIVNPQRDPALISAVLERHPNKRWVMDTQAVAPDGTVTSRLVSLFYEDEPYPGGSNYAIFSRDRSNPLEDGGTGVRVADGLATAETPFNGIVVGNEVIFSSHRHDFVSRGGHFIDGGRDYVRTTMFDYDKHVLLVVKDGKLVVSDERPTGVPGAPRDGDEAAAATVA